MRLGAILAVAVPLKVKIGQAADVTHTFYKHGVLPHKVQDGISAVGQGKVEHKWGQQDAGHLFHKQAGLQVKPCPEFCRCFLFLFWRFLFLYETHFALLFCFGVVLRHGPGIQQACPKILSWDTVQGYYRVKACPEIQSWDTASLT